MRVNNRERPRRRAAHIAFHKSMDKYSIERTCGEGTFAVVYAARASDGGRVAIKKLKQPVPSWEACMTMRELRAFKTCGRHANVVGLRELVLAKQELYFVFEFLDSNLFELISKSPRPFGEDVVRRMAGDLLHGLQHIHSRGFMHRDLKPENVLCDRDGSCLKIGDLGLAREIRSRPPYTDYVATRWYRAPELCLRTTVYASAVDVWAVGCIVGEIICRGPLLPGTSDVDMLVRTVQLIGGFDESSWAEGVLLARRSQIHLPPPCADGGPPLIERRLKQLHAPASAIALIR